MINDTELYENNQPDTAVDNTQQVESTQPNEQQITESSKETNMRELRLKAERAERERDEAVQYINQIRQEALQYQQEQQRAKATQPVDEDDEFAIADDALVEGKDIKRKDKTYKKKINNLEVQLQEQRKQLDQQAAYSRELAVQTQLRNRYPDAEELLTESNISTLRSRYPEIAASLAATPDLLNKALSTCRLIKELNISQHNQYDVDKQRVAQNNNKPRSLQSISPQQGDSPLHQANAFANGLTPELKKSLYKEMLEKSKQGRNS